MRYKRMIHDDNRIVLVNAIQNPGIKEKIMKIFTELKKKGKTIKLENTEGQNYV